LVLLAEDDPTVSKIAARILTRAGYRVLTALDGRAAVELFEAHQDEFAVAMLDAVMPGLDGGAVYDRIKSIRPDLPVLFSSGNDKSSWPPALLEQRRVALLPKPYDPEMLLQALSALLRHDGRASKAG
jgi:DNA-binding response OmpR family regulator